MRDHLGGTGHVDEDVEASVALDGRRHEARRLPGVAHVGWYVASSRQLGGELLTRLHPRRRVDHDGGSAFGELTRNGGREPARRVGHQSDTTIHRARPDQRHHIDAVHITPPPPIAPIPDETGRRHRLHVRRREEMPVATAGPVTSTTTILSNDQPGGDSLIA